MNARRSTLSMAILISAAMTALLLSRMFAGEPNSESPKLPIFRTAKIARRDLVLHIGAPGTIEPQLIVYVGAQVDGCIVGFGDDRNAKGKSIDYGSKIQKGQVLAVIDDALYRARLEEEQAAIQVAEAKLALAQAKLQSAAVESQRLQAIVKSGNVPQADVDAAKSNALVAKATVDIAAAELARQEAAVRSAQIVLERTKITSPIDGVLIDRRVNVGQTVTANLNGPSLFLIAADLKKLEVWASLNEADMGQIHVGQNAQLTVDAFPNQSFKGKVAKVRLNAQVTQNVVTYTVVVSINDSDGKLLPYMTANVQFEVGQRDAVLLVPNAAVRWRPQPEWIAADAREKLAAGPPSHFPRDGSSRKEAQGRVWIHDGKVVRPVEVELGVSNATETEIIAGDLKEGQEIVIGATASATPEASQSGTNLDAAWQRAVQKTVQNDPALQRSLEQSAKVMQRIIDGMGTNLLQILPGTAASGGVRLGGPTATTLTVRDAQEVIRNCPAVSEAVPIVRARAQLVHGDRRWVPIMIYGTAPTFLIARSWEGLADGDIFTDGDITASRNVCVVGETVQRELFGDERAIGKEIRIGSVPFRVVGVLRHKGANIFGMDQDDLVLAPWTTINLRFRVSSAGGAETTSNAAPDQVDQILAKAASPEEVPAATAQITDLLRQRHHIKPGEADDFNIRDQNEANKAIQSVRNMLIAPEPAGK